MILQLALFLFSLKAKDLIRLYFIEMPPPSEHSPSLVRNYSGTAGDPNMSAMLNTSYGSKEGAIDYWRVPEGKGKFFEMRFHDKVVISISSQGKLELDPEWTAEDAAVIMAGQMAEHLAYMSEAEESKKKQIKLAQERSSEPIRESTRRALREAVTAWRKVIPETPMPNLKTGWCGPVFEDNTIACAKRASGTIIMQDQTVRNMVNVMMHEVGHLLGVPHIEGDALMNQWVSTTPLSAPTKAAVALAKLAME